MDTGQHDPVWQIPHPTRRDALGCGTPRGLEWELVLAGGGPRPARTPASGPWSLIRFHHHHLNSRKQAQLHLPWAEPLLSPGGLQGSSNPRATPARVGVGASVCPQVCVCMHEHRALCMCVCARTHAHLAQTQPQAGRSRGPAREASPPHAISSSCLRTRFCSQHR